MKTWTSPDHALKQSFHFGDRQIELLLPDPTKVREAWRNEVADETEFPFWTRVWPSALGLCQYLLDHQEWIRGRLVLEIGAGLGLPSLYAATLADAVICTDLVPDAVAFAAASVGLNGFSNMRSEVLDWKNHAPRLPCNTLLLSDVNYAPAAFGDVMRLLSDYVQAGTVVLISTPHRITASAFVQQIHPWIAEHNIIRVHHEADETDVSVFRLQNDV